MGGILNPTIADGSITASKLAGGAVTGSLGFTPVQQGTGSGQLSNAVKMGWSGSNLRVQVDGTDFGAAWPIAATGSQAMGAVGTYTWATNMGATVNAGASVSGGTLSPSMSGTWQNMINAQAFNGSAALWLRIA